jgi:hypothetical protein
VPGLLSRKAMTEQGKRRLRVVSTLALAAVAVLSWWMVIEEGASGAKLLAAIATSVGVLLEIALPGRRRLLRRSRTNPGVEED